MPLPEPRNREFDRPGRIFGNEVSSPVCPFRPRVAHTLINFLWKRSDQPPTSRRQLAGSCRCDADIQNNVCATQKSQFTPSLPLTNCLESSLCWWKSCNPRVAHTLHCMYAIQLLCYRVNERGGRLRMKEPRTLASWCALRLRSRCGESSTPRRREIEVRLFVCPLAGPPTRLHIVYRRISTGG